MNNPTAEKFFELLWRKRLAIIAEKGHATREDCQRIWQEELDTVKRLAAETGTELDEFCVSRTLDEGDDFFSQMFCNEGFEEGGVFTVTGAAKGALQ